MRTSPHSGGRRENEHRRDGAERKRKIRFERSPDVNDGKLSTFLAGEELGLGHAVGDGVGWVVERELVAEAPSKDAATQQHESKGEPADTPAGAEGQALGQVG
jgi:hypothetical protein